MPKKDKDVVCCPKCKNLVEARKYMNPAIVGFLDSILPTFNCDCGYTGLPIKMTIKEYEKWVKK